MKVVVDYLCEFGVVIVLTIAVLLGSSAIAWPDEVETCQYIWHDHYKNNYRVRHRHEVCESLAAHYAEDPARTQVFHTPEVYEGVEDTEKSN